VHEHADDRAHVLRADPGVRHVAEVTWISQARMHHFREHLPCERSAVTKLLAQHFGGIGRAIEADVREHVA
jgi:hypothetical protein